MTTSDPLEADLAEALERRGSTIVVLTPDPTTVRVRATNASSSRSWRPAVVAASLMVLAGALSLAVWQPIGTVSDSTQTSLPATSDGTPPDIINEMATPVTVVDWASLPDPGPLVESEGIDFALLDDDLVTALSGIGWIGNVAGQFVVIENRIDLDDSSAQQQLLLSDDGVSWRSVSGPPGQAIWCVIADGDQLVAATYGFDGDEIRTHLWNVDQSFIKHSQQLIEYELSDLAEGSGAWRGVNRPLLFFIDGTLYAAQAATPGVLGGEPLAEYSGPGTQRTFIVDLSDDAPARIVAELAGHPSAIRVDDGRVSVALYGSRADAELMHWVASSSAPGQADQWAVREVPGISTLANGVEADAWSVSDGIPASMYRVGGRGDARLGTLPDGLSPAFADWSGDHRADTIAFVWLSRPAGVLADQVLGISATGAEWTWIDINERFGPTQNAAITELDGVVLLITMYDGRSKLRVADLN